MFGFVFQGDILQAKVDERRKLARDSVREATENLKEYLKYHAVRQPQKPAKFGFSYSKSSQSSKKTVMGFSDMM